MKTPTMDKRIADYLAQTEGHTLEEITDPTSRVRAFYLRRPGTRVDSTLITFTPEGIAIQGDATPSQRGDVSALGYGIEWFAGNLSPDYLAEKFLEQTFVPEFAASVVREWAENADAEAGQADAAGEPKGVINRLFERAEAFREIAQSLDDGEMGSEGLAEALADMEVSYDGEGWGHDPNKAAHLVAIQRRFAELYAKREVPASSAGPEPRAP